MNYQFIQGIALEVARALQANSLHCIVTSPPYYRLRDYQTATWEGGEPTCQHTISEDCFDPKKGEAIARPYRNVDRGFCIKCGARRVDQQMGLENSVNCQMQGKLKIKENLSEDQLRFVIQRLLDAGLLDGHLYDTDDIK